MSIKINEIPKQIYDQFEKAEPKYLIAGIIKTQTGQHQFQSFHVANDEELYFQIESPALVRFRVFDIKGQNEIVEGSLKQKAQEFMEMKRREQRYSKWLELDKEFGNVKMEVVS